MSKRAVVDHRAHGHPEFIARRVRPEPHRGVPSGEAAKRLGS